MQDIINDRCIICENAESKPLFNIKDHLVSGEIFSLHECTGCGFRFVVNPPPEQKAGKYYETEEYVEHSDDASGWINTVYHQARRWMLIYKARLLSKEHRKQKILDFGTGTGYFLNFMKSKGYEVTGVEISSRAQAFGKEKFGLSIHHPDDIFDGNFDSNYGYITFWHVLEHVYNIDQVFKRVHQLLDKKGVLVVALPNYQCIEESIYKTYWNGYDVPRHLWHFSPKQFEKYARKHHFELKHTAILPLDPFYNCLISESYRKKKWMLLFIPIIGLTSLILGFFFRSRASSIVYFLVKDHD